MTINKRPDESLKIKTKRPSRASVQTKIQTRKGEEKMLATKGRIYFETLEEIIEMLDDIIEVNSDPDLMTAYRRDKVEAVKMLKRDICYMKHVVDFTTRK